jgi:site-specific DNA-methyltransferase (adenine-specific)
MFKPVRPDDPFGLAISPEGPVVGAAVSTVDGVSEAEDWRAAMDSWPVRSPRKSGLLFADDVLEALDRVVAEHSDGVFDAIFADPPFFISGERQSMGVSQRHEFDLAWLSRCQKLLKPNGTIWVSGPLSFVRSAGFAMQQLCFKLLNDVYWVKENMQPSHRRDVLTRKSEAIIWAAKTEKSKHYFDYKLMKEMNGGKQMKSVWPIPAPQVLDPEGHLLPWSKPEDLTSRMLLASTKPGDLILDLSPASDGKAAIALEFGRRYTDLSMEGL